MESVWANQAIKSLLTRVATLEAKITALEARSNVEIPYVPRAAIFAEPPKRGPGRPRKNA